MHLRLRPVSICGSAAWRIRLSTSEPTPPPQREGPKSTLLLELMVLVVFSLAGWRSPAKSELCPAVTSSSRGVAFDTGRSTQPGRKDWAGGGARFTLLTHLCSQWKGCERGDGAKCQNQERPARDTQVRLFVTCPPLHPPCRIPLIRAHVCCSGLAWCPAEAVRPSPTAPAPPACPGLDGEQCTSPSWRVRRNVQRTETLSVLVLNAFRVSCSTTLSTTLSTAAAVLAPQNSFLFGVISR